MPIALVVLPALAGILALLLANDALRRGLLVATALAHLSLLLATAATATGDPHALFALDAPGLLFLGLASVLFVATSIYAVGYLRAERTDERPDFVAGVVFRNAPERVFTACLLFFLAAMSLVCLTRHLGLLWVGVECTTLASAPLIYFHRHHRSLEATWKYLLICSVGIAFALMGLLFLNYASLGLSGSLHLDRLLADAPTMHPVWLKAAFLFLLVGYGCKMGLAPMHHWLPDAHSEAPSLVSALLSGALLNCAFLGIIRGHQVCAAAGLAPFSGGMLVLLGLVSLGTAAVFVVGQGDFKRMLAYSSVEHMGLLALALGTGGSAALSGMLHTINHSCTKAALFLLSGNILALYHTKSSYDARGLFRTLPITGVLWMLGFLSITGTPPFGTFVSELGIIHGLLAQGRWGVATITMVCLAVIFVGMSSAVARMVHGPKPRYLGGIAREDLSSVGPSAFLVAVVLLLGIVQPEGLRWLVAAAMRVASGMEEGLW